MAQASAQREPSMEEILASIRRIIEDSDNVRRPAEMPRPDPEPAAPARAEVETFRSELGAVAERRPALAAVGPPVAAARAPEPAQASGAAPKAFRLAEVQAEVTREAAAQPKAPDAGGRPVSLADVQKELTREPVAAARPAAAPAGPAPQPPRLEVPPRTAEIQSSPEPKIEKPALQPVIQKSAEPVVLEAKTREPVLAVDAAARLDAVAKPIISQAAGRQVAAAFGQLSEAFALRANKTFDEMAEQMLRPMLQEWLDNNLPVLVERLVREEIERVARGV